MKELKIKEAGTLPEQPNDVFVGRADELKLAEKEYEKVVLGSFGAVTITGKSGVGKTYLVEQFVKSKKSSVTYVSSKCQLNDNISSRVADEIISQIVFNFLILPNASFISVKAEIEKSLGADIDILISICPKAKEMFGERKFSYISDFEKLRYRVRSCVSKFLLIAAEHLFPLVIFVDDIQWGNELTLNLLKGVLSKPSSYNLLFITAYRDEETTKSMQPFKNLLRKNTEVINIFNMTADLIEEYLEEYFGAGIENIESIAGIIYTVTGGRPLFIKDLVRLYESKNVFKKLKAKGTYKADMARVKSAGVQRDYESILKSKVESIPDEYTNLIDILACLNGSADYYLLLKASGLDSQGLDRQLDFLSSLLIIIDSGEDGTRQISFSHDMLHKMAYEKLSDKRKSDVSFNLANVLRQSGGENDELNSRFSLQLQQPYGCSRP